MYRKGSMMEAVFNSVGEMSIGESKLLVVIGFDGVVVDAVKLRMALSKVAADIKMLFTTRSTKDGLMVWRIE